MGAKITYRHNVLTINSIETFLSVKGGFHNHVRDVYFVRGVGEPADLAKRINDIDKKMGMEMADNRLKYIRINSLPQIRELKDSDYYSAVYDQWRNGAAIKLQNLNVCGELEDIMGEAYSQVIDYYAGSKDSVSSSMVRNFAAKVLFWLDKTAAGTLSEWNEKICVKVIADNIVKEQEYLFYLFLTLLGCDVLLIENREDVNVSEKLKQFSYELALGKFGNAKLSEYVPYVPDKTKVSRKAQTPVKQTEAAGSQSNKVVIPERPNRARIVQPQAVQSAFVNPAYAAGAVHQNAEKSFEELAQLASSIVLIAVHDSDGEIIGTGSGIMIGRGGYILTNNHVASGGHFYSVRIEDDEEVYATDEVIKYNSTTDLAVIRIRRQLNPLSIYRGSKKLVRGQKVVAIGSPLGLFNSVSDGIISGFRNINEVDMIQFTAPISHGSSGGAVLNMQGEVVGISTAGIDSGQNINLAIGYESILLFASGFFN